MFNDTHTLSVCANSLTPLDGLYRIISAANSTRSLDAALQTVAETVADVIGIDVCSIFLFDRDRGQLYLRATKGLNLGAIGELRLSLGQGIAGVAAQEGRPIVVPDVGRDQRFYVDPRLDEQRYGSMVCVPIILFARHEGVVMGDQLHGVISIQSIAHRTFGEDVVHFLEVVAGELAFFIANAQRYQQTDAQLHQKIRELTTLQQVSAAIVSTLDLQIVLTMIAEHAATLARADRVDIFQSDELGEQVTRLTASGGPADERLQRVIRHTITAGHPLAVVSACDDARFPELAAVAASHGYHSLFCIPLRVGGRIIGALALSTRAPRSFDYAEMQMLATFADQAAIAIENARLFREVRHALRSKEVLLKELKHRVGNNLEVLKSLLEMQERRLESGSLGATALAHSVGRIHAIAALHELLSGEDVGNTTILQVAQRVIQHIPLISPVPVQFKVLAQPIRIGSREATRVALIVNELVMNAFRHGLAAEGGTVEVDAWRDGSEVVLEVRDDGPRHPVGPPHPSTGLGHALIQGLVQADLNGTFQFERDQTWTYARIRFPYEVPSAESGHDDIRRTGD